MNDDPLYKEITSRAEQARRTLPVENAELAALFNGILQEMHGERRFDDVDLLDQVERVKAVLLSVTGETTTESRLPGGSLVHRLVRKLTRRQVKGLADQVQSLFVVQQQLIETLVAREIVHQLRETRLAGVLSQHVLDRLAVLESIQQELADVRESVRPS